MRIKNADLKIFFLEFAAFRASLMKEKAADCHMLLRMIGEIKVSRDGFRCVHLSFPTSRRCFLNWSPSRLPVLLFAKGTSYAGDNNIS